MAACPSPILHVHESRCWSSATILGKVEDSNSPWIAVVPQPRPPVVSIIVLPDDIEQVAAGGVDRRCDFVFTWWCGPTHDDLTMAATRAGLVAPSRPILKCRRHSEANGGTFHVGRSPNGHIPSGADLWWDGELRFPQVVVGNVVVFPGSFLLRLKFDAIGGYAGRLGAAGHHARRVGDRRCPERCPAAVFRRGDRVLSTVQHATVDGDHHDGCHRYRTARSVYRRVADIIDDAACEQPLLRPGSSRLKALRVSGGPPPSSAAGEPAADRKTTAVRQGPRPKPRIEA